MPRRTARLAQCVHAYCAAHARQWCLLSGMEGIPTDMPACTCRWTGTPFANVWWHSDICEFEAALAALVPEPPDGTRIEFEHWTDRHAAWRDDVSSRRTGWPDGDGGMVWCTYGHSVPVTWTRMVYDYGPTPLRNAVRLVPHPDDLDHYTRWPTNIRAAEGKPAW